MNEQALKDRLKYIAIERNCSFQEVWKLFLLEQLLVRLARSKYNNQLIFKGGLLLSYYLLIGRETTDIDLLARQLQAKIPKIQNTLIEICSTQIDDGLTMSLRDIEELEHSHMNYPGYRVRINVQLAKMRDCIQVDIGVGDVVEPVQIEWPLFQYKKQPLFENFISLQVYPVESIFSEKLEAIISRGAANSRMKDFHDILLLCRKSSLINMDILKNSINKTFSIRGTKIEIPILFSENEYLRLQNLWVAHLRTLGDVGRQALKLPEDIFSLIQEVNVRLEPFF